MPARLVVSVHDVAPASERETARWCADADAFGIPVSILVIPGPWRGASLADAPDYGKFLRERRAHGDEIMLHGWEHRAPKEGSFARRAVARMVARGAAEFAALDVAAADARLRQAITVMNEMGLTTTGFTPPGWLSSPAGQYPARKRTHRQYAHAARLRGRRLPYGAMLQCRSDGEQHRRHHGTGDTARQAVSVRSRHTAHPGHPV
ncbi:DUF2334 domain-containing protein [Nocardia pseudovaccinii]|uniref:DUF2334 domain-containing protein n=1 Tax=Nocardia pseudovaccinii TaxID=189540 RepID=UPI003D8D94C0